MNMSKRTKLAAAGGALLVAGFVAGAAAAVTGSATAGTDVVTGSQPGRPGGPGGEEPLTGTTADKVTAAVEARYPNATIERVETDSDGVYEAHIVTSDGDEIVVQVGEDFTITGTQTDPHGAPDGDDA